MCSSCGYKSLPYVLALISILELILGVIRIYIFFSPESPPGYPDGTPILTDQLVPSPFLSSTQAKVAFAIDWIASIVPTFMGLYVAFFLLLACCSVLACCGCVHDTVKGRDGDLETVSDMCSTMCFMCKSRSNHRCVTLSCNCPCYIARPQLRFHVRFVLFIFFIILRIVAIALYASDKTVHGSGYPMAVVCAASLVLIFLVLLLDYYQYRVWWFYRPNGAYKKCRCCCCRQKFHPSLKRFLPYPLLGEFRSPKMKGNRPCENTVSGQCRNLSLEHIVIFHALDYIPQRRYAPGQDTKYIVFHQTSLDKALLIAETGFCVSNKNPLMLGHGVYFARSFQVTDNKARFKGRYHIY
jgi:hypothetical protein